MTVCVVVAHLWYYRQLKKQVSISVQWTVPHLQDLLHAKHTGFFFSLPNASGFSALQASPSIIEIHDSMTECEEEARPNLVQMEEKAFIASLHSFMKDRGSPIERIPHLGFKQSEFMSAALAGEWTQYSHGIWMKKTSCVCLFHSQLIFGASTKLWRNLGAMIQ